MACLSQESHPMSDGGRGMGGGEREIIFKVKMKKENQHNAS